MKINLSSNYRRIILSSLIIAAIVFLTYVSVRSFWADMYYRRAKKFSLNLASWKKAAVQYEKAISILPGNATYHEEAGRLYSKLFMLYQNEDYFKKAVYHFRKSFQLNPYNAWSHYYLAWTYWNREMYTEAEKEAKKAIQLDPNNATYHWQLASIYERMGKLEQAIDEYKKVLRILPGYSKAKEMIKKIEEKLKEKIQSA